MFLTFSEFVHNVVRLFSWFSHPLILLSEVPCGPARPRTGVEEKYEHFLTDMEGLYGAAKARPSPSHATLRVWNVVPGLPERRTSQRDEPP